MLVSSQCMSHSVMVHDVVIVHDAVMVHDVVMVPVMSTTRVELATPSD